MNIRIGLDDAADQVSIDTTARARIALLGPPGCGKTTTCRYVARRWLASTGGPCLIVTPRPYEYGNLDVAHIQDPALVSVPAQAGMLILDEADLIAAELVERAVRSAHQLIIVTSFGQTLTDLTTSTDDGPPDFPRHLRGGTHATLGRHAGAEPPRLAFEHHPGIPRPAPPHRLSSAQMGDVTNTHPCHDKERP